MIKWNLKDDTFEHGQWFKGRIYERRCDLSPDGTFLIYFAATYKKPLASWTAISKPPFFTALSLWPKGDGWNGGGYFVGPSGIHLDHAPGEDAPHPDYLARSHRFRVASHASVRGEDAPVWHFTLERDGWTQADGGEWHEYGEEKGYSWKAIRPEMWQKPNPKLALRLEMAIDAINQANGPWYVTRYRAVGEMEELNDLGFTDWADWSKRGDLLFAQRGSLFRQPLRGRTLRPPVLLADFNGSKFQNVKPPAWATRF